MGWAEDEDSLEEECGNALDDDDDVATEEEVSESGPEWHDERVSEDELEDDSETAEDEDSCTPIEEFGDSWAEDPGTLDDDSSNSSTDEELKAKTGDEAGSSPHPSINSANDAQDTHTARFFKDFIPTQSFLEGDSRSEAGMTYIKIHLNR